MEKLWEIKRTLSIELRNPLQTADENGRKHLTAYWQADGHKKAIAIGIHPSRTNQCKSDNTISRLGRFLEAYGFCEYFMLNLFEHYVSYPYNTTQIRKTNFQSYMTQFEAADAILIAWGMEHKYLEEKKEALEILKKHKDKIYCIECTSGAKPKHPSRLYYNEKLVRYHF
ncbi:MAG: DUF1643 domain-containing protein [Lachnospiraceae bacterium]